MPTRTSSGSRLQRMQSVISRRQKDFILVLEDIHDPHNAAAILRTADAFGIQNVYFVFEKEAKYDPKKVGKVSSSTANKWLTYKLFDSTLSCIEALKQEKYVNIMTALNGKSESIYEFEWPPRIALWLGNEHSGLSPVAISAADRLLSVPMYGMVQSLNVSVTAGICLHSALFYRIKSGQNYTLDGALQKDLLADFMGR